MLAKIVSAMKAHPVVPEREGDIDCALVPYGCGGRVRANAFRIVVDNETALGTCADFSRHAELLRGKGSDSDAVQLFRWIVSHYRRLNGDRKPGDPVKNLDLREVEAAKA